MGYINWFEEIRFIAELLIAEWLFLLPFAKRQKHFRIKMLTGAVILVVMSLVFGNLYKNIFDIVPMIGRQLLAIIWYVFITLLSVAYQWICFRPETGDLMYLCACGYVLQHLDFLIVNEMLVLYLCPGLRNYILGYSLVCVGITIVLYGIMYNLFVLRLRECEGELYQSGKRNSAFLSVYFLTIVIVTFGQQAVFQHIDMKYRYLAILMDAVTCILILFVQYNMLRISQLSREQRIISQLMYERQKQYESEKSNIEVINRKCHDLKHQIMAIKNVSSDEQEQYIDEVKSAVMMFDTFAKTENEILNTIITNKGIYCEQKNIRLSFVADGKQLEFMKDMDIYSMVGNALDNAIECVERIEDPQKRVISLVISRKGNFLCMQEENYCYDDIDFKEGIPVTSKRNKDYHGFGVKSIKYIVEKYGGTMMIDYRDNIFMLQILMPIPV